MSMDDVRIEQRPGQVFTCPHDEGWPPAGGGQVTAGIPSQRLVIVRTGQDAGSIYEPIARLIAAVSRGIG